VGSDPMTQGDGLCSAAFTGGRARSGPLVCKGLEGMEALKQLPSHPLGNRHQLRTGTDKGNPTV